MYTIPRENEELFNYDICRDILDYAEAHNGRLLKLKEYYRGKQAIIDRSKGGDYLSNNKVMVNHAKYIVDVNTSYLLGNPVDYQASEGVDIEALKDTYKAQTINDLDVEIVKGCGIYGKQYEYVYANEEAEPRSAILDDMSVVLVRDNTMEHKKMYAVLYRPVFDNSKSGPNQLLYTEVTVVGRNKTRSYKMQDQTLTPISEEFHVFGDVPVIEYKNNAEEMGDFEPVISLIDAYNLLQSDRINDKEQLVDAILCFYNMDFDPEDADALKAHRVIAGIPADGKVEYLVKTLNETDTDVLRKTIENDIHKISMVPNMSDENFIGNSSGVAIRYKLLAFEQNIKNKERYLEKGLMDRFTLYNNFLATKNKMAIVPATEVDAVFKRNLPSNDYETSQMIANLDGKVDQETLIAQLSFVKDAKEIAELAAKENETRQAMPPFEEIQE